MCLDKIAGWIINSGGDSGIKKQLKQLPPDFFYKNDLLFGPTGVWLLKINARAKYTSLPGNGLTDRLRSKADDLAVLIKDKVCLNVKVQPVLVLNNSRVLNKFEFFRAEGVYIIQKRWLSRLITDYPVQPLNREEAEKIMKACEV